MICDRATAAKLKVEAKLKVYWTTMNALERVAEIEQDAVCTGEQSLGHRQTEPHLYLEGNVCPVGKYLLKMCFVIKYAWKSNSLDFFAR